jgi:hypothetical protein
VIVASLLLPEGEAICLLAKRNIIVVCGSRSEVFEKAILLHHTDAIQTDTLRPSAFPLFPASKIKIYKSQKFKMVKPDGSINHRYRSHDDKNDDHQRQFKAKR